MGVKLRLKHGLANDKVRSSAGGWRVALGLAGWARARTQGRLASLRVSRLNLRSYVEFRS